MNLYSTLTRLLVASVGALAVSACGADMYEEEVGQATGDVMASMDEQSQGAHLASAELPAFRGRDFLAPSLLDRTMNAIFPTAQAAACSGSSFSTCSSGQETRSFSDCSYGSWTVNGSVTLDFSESACSFLSAGDTITRTADFQITGPRGATLAVTSPNGGQRVTKTASGFNYTVLGMERIATASDGRKLFDVSTKTTSDIGVTGTSRADRVVNGGVLEVTHNLAGYVVDLTPNNLTWAATCNCPVSGSLTGTATGSVDGTFTVDITGCSTATITAQGSTKERQFNTTKTVQLDRCSSAQ